ncbi:uncharacterized protein LOC142768490 [Rhipicephalus microplus]|uniref:uncharacterized protein LOC142768490 n=1 Tax=Rhipicephalus microplus TaxID=6941 RepID=UPI003F6C9462
MAASHVSVLLFVLLVSFCEESLEAGGWTEDRNPDRPATRAVAQFAYLNRKPRTSAGVPFTFLVTQARTKILQDLMFNLGFIVFRGHELVEKCITIVAMPRPGGVRRRANVIKFWCR